MEFDDARARAFAEGFTYLPLRAFVAQMEALIDLVHAWTGLHAPTIAKAEGPVIQIAPYRYRASSTFQKAARRRRLPGTPSRRGG